VNSVHPGVIVTNIANISDKEKNLELFQNFSTSLIVPLISIEEGAATTVYLVFSEDGAKSGGFNHKTTLAETSPFAKDEQLGKSLWELTEKLTGINEHSNFFISFLPTFLYFPPLFLSFHPFHFISKEKKKGTIFLTKRSSNPIERKRKFEKEKTIIRQGRK